jgi:myo-inositol 2-dehydrogenase/D-chiro-inositol 1-dehydrogenase
MQAVVSNSRFNGRGHDVRLEIHASNDSVAAGIEPSWPIRSTESGVTFPDGSPHHFFMDRFSAAFRAELAAFTECARARSPRCGRRMPTWTGPAGSDRDAVQLA